MTLSRIAAVIVIAGLVVSAGCGDSANVATVSGTVTLDGAPATEGSITFAPADGLGPSAGAMIKDGKYEVTAAAKMPPGKKIVTIQVSTKTGRKVESGPPAPPGTLVDEIKTYPKPGGTPDLQSAELVPGPNTADFQLVSGARAAR